jgi:hypothetical protein
MWNSRLESTWFDSTFGKRMITSAGKRSIETPTISAARLSLASQKCPPGGHFRAWTGQERSGMDGTGLEWIGLDWNGWDWNGLDWRFSMSMPTEIHPFDCSKLNKGDTIPAAVIETATNSKRTDRNYRLKMLNLRDFIFKQLIVEKRPATVRISGDTIKILSDSEASPYNDKHFAFGHQKAQRAFARNLFVDRSKLTEEERITHDHRVYVQGRILQAMRAESRRITADNAAKLKSLPDNEECSDQRDKDIDDAANSPP